MKYIVTLIGEDNFKCYLTKDTNVVYLPEDEEIEFDKLMSALINEESEKNSPIWTARNIYDIKDSVSKLIEEFRNLNITEKDYDDNGDSEMEMTKVVSEMVKNNIGYVEIQKVGGDSIKLPLQKKEIRKFRVEVTCDSLYAIVWAKNEEEACNIAMDKLDISNAIQDVDAEEVEDNYTDYDCYDYTRNEEEDENDEEEEDDYDDEDDEDEENDDMDEDAEEDDENDEDEEVTNHDLEFLKIAMAVKEMVDAKNNEEIIDVKNSSYVSEEDVVKKTYNIKYKYLVEKEIEIYAKDKNEAIEFAKRIPKDDSKSEELIESVRENFMYDSASWFDEFEVIETNYVVTKDNKVVNILTGASCDHYVDDEYWTDFDDDDNDEYDED